VIELYYFPKASFHPTIQYIYLRCIFAIFITIIILLCIPEFYQLFNAFHSYCLTYHIFLYLIILYLIIAISKNISVRYLWFLIIDKLFIVLACKYFIYGLTRLLWTPVGTYSTCSPSASWAISAIYCQIYCDIHQRTAELIVLVEIYPEWVPASVLHTTAYPPSVWSPSVIAKCVNSSLIGPDWNCYFLLSIYHIRIIFYQSTLVSFYQATNQWIIIAQ
jgi:hypothetical protein